MKYVLVVGRDYYRTTEFAESLKNELGDQVAIATVFRTYHAEDDAPNADVIIGGYTCYSRIDGEKIPVWFSSRSLARKANKPFIPIGAFRMITRRLALHRLRKLIAT